MPRPVRIEYEDAYYHVMNRGRGRKAIFHGDAYYKAFLRTLEEAYQRFKLQILCYCLMGNHYHLLVKTPEANLGRAMRHINGLYTQRYNRLRKVDGPLFRGRYKAILVEEDSYQLQLSRYIHRNPIEAGLVDRLEDYPWSSYPYYVCKLTAPEWLYCEEIYDQLSVKSRRREKYRVFVEMGVDKEIAAFYGKGNQVPYLGSDAFRDWAYRQRQTDESELDRKTIQSFRPPIEQVIDSVAKHFKVDADSITRSQRGRVNENIPRWIVTYLAQETCGLKLREIANYLGLKRTGSIPLTIAKLKSRAAIDAGLARMVKQIKSEYDT
jgi:REP element-mobilizing transposase RayT